MSQANRDRMVWLVGFVLVANFFGALPIPPTIVVIWTMSLFADVLFVACMAGTWYLCTQSRKAWLATPFLVLASFLVCSSFAFGSDRFFGPPQMAYEGFVAALTYGWIGVFACTVMAAAYCKQTFQNPKPAEG